MRGGRRLGRWLIAAGVTAAGVIAAAPGARAVIGADLSITKTDGMTTVTAGESVTYTIVASNPGPFPSFTPVVTDTFPASLTNVAWTCVGAGGGTCTPAGTGNINDPVGLPAGGSVTYTVSASVAPGATGTLDNTATVSDPFDFNVTNNTATDTDAIVAAADLSITKTDGITSTTAGSTVTYTITVVNAGPSDAPGATVVDAFPASLTNVSWICIGAGGGTCTAAGSGNINDAVNLPAGATLTYTVSATIAADATGDVANVATVSGPAGVIDPNPGNNTATDIDSLVVPTTTTTTTVAPTTTLAVPPTSTSVAPLPTVSLPATGSAAARRIAPWALAILVLGAFATVLATRRATRQH